MTYPSSAAKNFTRGGQITLHNFRMFNQIMDKVVFIAVLIFILVTVNISWVLTSEYERYVFGEFLSSTIIPLFDMDATTPFIQPSGVTARVKYSDIRKAILVKTVVHSVYRKLIYSMMVGLIFGSLTFFIISWWLRKKGKVQSEDTLIKGDELASKDATKKRIIKAKCNSDLVLAGLPLIKNMETRHFFFHGTTGTGKSNAIKELLDQIRKRGDRAIIYDIGCNYLEEFYLSNQDKLLNPMDVRGESWHLWSECRDSADFDSLAAAQIPMPLSTQDPFWVNAARTIFSAAAFEMRNDPERNVIKLLRYLLTSDLQCMENYLKGTEAETLTSRKTEKTAISIKSVLATYLKSMKYIKDKGHSFSIRQWIQNEEGNNWLFITSLDDRHETLKPLITAWLDIAVNALMSLPSNEERRIWLVLDELTSLHKLPYLIQTLSKARKFGGCVVVGIQNFAQLEEEYGNRGARKISSLLNTRYLFREPDPDMARWSADNLGEGVKNEIHEGRSYGANTIRDGVSINLVETRKPVVSYSEIMSLGDLQAYVRLPGEFPITAVDFQFKQREKHNNGFIQRKIDESQLKEVDQLIGKYEMKYQSQQNKPVIQKLKKKKIKENKETIESQKKLLKKTVERSLDI